jgi:hypothetical protein
MKTFKQLFEVKSTNGVKHAMASSADRKKGEVYAVVDIKNKVLVVDGLKRVSAKAIADTDKDLVSGSASFIFDKYTSTWNK